MFVKEKKGRRKGKKSKENPERRDPLENDSRDRRRIEGERGKIKQRV